MKTPVRVIATMLVAWGCGDDGPASVGGTESTTTGSQTVSSTNSSSTADGEDSSSDGTSTTTGEAGLPPSFLVEGTVVDQDGTPVAGAWIM
jgi:protocatechuate 3,4-dioxygenase beta subunit